ncbi:MAG: tetratricopeptide repeat protein [Planctomycetota bacterium]
MTASTTIFITLLLFFARPAVLEAAPKGLGLERAEAALAAGDLKSCRDVLRRAERGLRTATSAELVTYYSLSARVALELFDPELSLLELRQAKKHAGERRFDLDLIEARAQAWAGNAKGVRNALESHFASKPSKPSVEAAVLLAEAWVESGRSQDGEKLLAEQAARPDTQTVSFRLGVVLFERGDYTGAMKHFEPASRSANDAYYARIYLARCALKRRDNTRALKECSAAKSIATTPEVHYLTARAHASTKDQAKAIAEYRAALRMSPSYAEASYGLANALRERGDLNAAKNEFARYRSLQMKEWKRLRDGTRWEQRVAGDTSALVALRAAEFHAETHAYDQAERYAWISLRRDERQHDARLILARALRNQGRRNEALLHLRKILYAQPDHESAEQELKSLMSVWDARRR